MNNTYNNLLSGYENIGYYSYKEMEDTFPNSIYYDDLPNHEVRGILKASRYVNGRLLQTYSNCDTHAGVIAATRLGKTTSFVIPQIFAFAKAKNKKSMLISDPKGELYRKTSTMLRDEGYKVLLLNFRDYQHSECWNPLTPIFRKYQSVFNLYDHVEVVDTETGPKNKFNGKIYSRKKDLDNDLERWKSIMLTEVGNDIDAMALIVVPTIDVKDPYWEDSARELLKAYLWAMLEDSRPEFVKDSRSVISEDTFSFATIISLMTRLNVDEDNFDDGYFTERPHSSKAYQIAKATIPVYAKTTRQCITSIFSSKMSVFRESAMRLITSCNSFDMNILTGDEPIALFVCYRDELKVHYTVISMFIQDAYKLLIEHANAQEEGKRKIPFYFILDEFANMPALKDFETVISACAGRNIFFILILQSYAQLNAVYGSAVAEIIRDNLNMHVFFGSNNPATLEEFSKECGQITRISPLSALNGKNIEIDNYQLETIPLMPKSRLARFETGECVITEANSGYVLLSKLERYYLCKEYSEFESSDEKEYQGNVNPFEKRFIYVLQEKKKRNSHYEF